MASQMQEASKEHSRDNVLLSSAIGAGQEQKSSILRTAGGSIRASGPMGSQPHESVHFAVDD